MHWRYVRRSLLQSEAKTYPLRRYDVYTFDIRKASIGRLIWIMSSQVYQFPDGLLHYIIDIYDSFMQRVDITRCYEDEAYLLIILWMWKGLANYRLLWEWLGPTVMISPREISCVAQELEDHFLVRRKTMANYLRDVCHVIGSEPRGKESLLALYLSEAIEMDYGIGCCVRKGFLACMCLCIARMHVSPIQEGPVWSEEMEHVTGFRVAEMLPYVGKFRRAVYSRERIPFVIELDELYRKYQSEWFKGVSSIQLKHENIIMQEMYKIISNESLFSMCRRAVNLYSRGNLDDLGLPSVIIKLIN